MIAVQLVSLAAEVTLALLGLSAVLTFVRLARGPSLADRVVALDVVATIAICFVGVQTLLTDEVVYLRIATVVALVTFLGTIAFAYFVERRGEP